MGVQWTTRQQKVIESRRRNLLVSAAAGSGKTAVLVERIIRMITDKDRPLDIDSLLVMTFTKAAASEMRERVAAAVDKLLEKNPGDAHLQAQAVLIPRAPITTIDSFCLNLVREHFNRLDIDPSFRVADENEAALIRADVMEQMLEDRYGSGEEAFFRFVETYASGKADGGIEDYIFQVYDFSQSNPWPEQWIERCKREAECSGAARLLETPWMEFLMGDARLQAGELAKLMEEAAAVCGEPDGPAPYLPVIRRYHEILTGIRDASGYEELNRALLDSSAGKLSAVRSKEVDPEKKEYVYACRDRVKKALDKMKSLYCFGTLEETARDMENTREAVSTLLDLAADFGERYRKEKREKNILDFNDLEHCALDILYEERDGRPAPTEEAEELKSRFEEILVDEYQDSNEVQEAIVRSISRESLGEPNVFMVGDVKQSIYKFRLARPELFLEKYNSYGTEDGRYQKIELHQNFRSRKEVLEAVNYVFYRVMTENLGNIRYTEEEALHPGAVFAKAPGPAGGEAELLMVDTGGDALKQIDEEAADYTSRELEAKLIAEKIRAMTDERDGLLVWDKALGEAGGYRRAGYGDIVILLRSMSGWAEVFLNVLMNEGIPAFAESRMGYFNTIEVETVLSFLMVADNPMQDIPLAAFFKSPLAGLSDRELAHMAAVYKKNPDKGQDRGVYAAWKWYLKRFSPESGETDLEYPELYGKLKSAEELAGEFRRKASYLPIHELLYLLYEKTGYYDYVSAMPSGDTRRANLDMLAEKASSFEKTSYKGLFHFVRYIERMKSYNRDFGEAAISGENGDTVRIVSIHKSKGLEFPIVFLAGMGKKFNKSDAYGRILIDSDLGIATDSVDLENRLRATTLKKNVLKRKMELESMGEELRVLYVAMTRAKEKLVMTATDRYLGKKLERWKDVSLVDGHLPFTVLTGADSYLDWLLQSLSGPGQAPIVMREISVPELVDLETGRQAVKAASKEELLCFDGTIHYEKEYGERLEAALSYEYPYQEETRLHAKMSVSELKKMSQTADGEGSDFLPTIPAFMRPEEGAARGVFRGSAYHRVLELLDFSAVKSERDTELAIENLLEQKLLTREDRSAVSPSVVWGFLSSPLGARMSRAQAEGRLKKEQQFVMGVPACEMGVRGSGELVLVQGIIDAFMEEDGKLVVVDYKTDRAGEKELIGRYAKQLAYYRKALEQMTGKEVAEKIIYSLTLQKEIRL